MKKLHFSLMLVSCLSLAACSKMCGEKAETTPAAEPAAAAPAEQPAPAPAAEQPAGEAMPSEEGPSAGAETQAAPAGEGA